jgi:hypothetical protein
MGRPVKASKVRDKAAERKEQAQLVMFNIRNLCKLYGVTEDDLARLTNMTLRTFRSKEERSGFTMDELMIFAQELHVNAAQLFVMPVYPVEPIELY